MEEWKKMKEMENVFELSTFAHPSRTTEETGPLNSPTNKKTSVPEKGKDFSKPERMSGIKLTSVSWQNLGPAFPALFPTQCFPQHGGLTESINNQGFG